MPKRKRPEPNEVRPRATGGHTCKSCTHFGSPCKKRGTVCRHWHKSCDDYARNPALRAARIDRGGALAYPVAKFQTEWVDRPCMQCEIRPYERPVDSDYRMCSKCRERVNNRAAVFGNDEPMRVP